MWSGLTPQQSSTKFKDHKTHGLLITQFILIRQIILYLSKFTNMIFRLITTTITTSSHSQNRN